MQFRAWQCVALVLRRLPLAVSYFVADCAGWLAFTFWSRGRRNTIRNFARVLPGRSRDEIRRTARRSLANYCRYLVDFVRFPAMQPADILEIVEAGDAFENLDVALERGKGVVIVCMHFGNWDLGSGATAARGYPVTVVAETFADPRLDAMIVGARRGLGVNVVKIEKAAPSMIRTLRSNGLLALLIDRPMASDGVRVTFFGHEVEVPAGPARLALRTGAKIVPVAFPRIAANRPDVLTLADFSVEREPTGDTASDVRCLMQQIMDAHERFIRGHPEQWFMFRDMWPRLATVQAP